MHNYGANSKLVDEMFSWPLRGYVFDCSIKLEPLVSEPPQQTRNCPKKRCYVILIFLMMPNNSHQTYIPISIHPVREAADPMVYGLYDMQAPAYCSCIAYCRRKICYSDRCVLW